MRAVASFGQETGCSNVVRPLKLKVELNACFLFNVLPAKAGQFYRSKSSSTTEARWMTYLFIELANADITSFSRANART